ncbi:hypothetical protein [Nonomuraea basaltis]|nr:hypothetical protein [Nonomuraea basaltis]
MSDGLFALWWPWPYQERLPVASMPAEEIEPGERIPGLIDECN